MGSTARHGHHLQTIIHTQLLDPWLPHLQNGGDNEVAVWGEANTGMVLCTLAGTLETLRKIPPAVTSAPAEVEWLPTGALISLSGLAVMANLSHHGFLLGRLMVSNRSISLLISC